MDIRELMTTDVETVRTHESGNTAAQRMWDADVGIVPVVDDHDRLVGVVTDRDLCMATYTRGRPLSEITVSEVMIDRPVSCREGESIERVEELMRAHQVRRVPVVDAGRHVIGIVSINDLVRDASERGLGHAEVVTTLAEVGRRRGRSVHDAA